MTDPEPTSEYTMSDKQKKSVPSMIRDMEIEQGGFETRVAKIERWQDKGEPDSPNPLRRVGVNDHIQKLYFYFGILWKVGSVLGIIFMAVFTWLLTKI